MQVRALTRRYKLWAKLYNRILDPVFAFDRKRVVEALKLSPGRKVLEVGVGTGLNLPFYPQRIEVTGVDLSEEMLAKAAEAAEDAQAQIRLMHLDGNALPFEDKSFDAALATFVVRVAPDPRELLREVARVLNPGARFIIYDVFADSKKSSVKQMVTHWLGWGRDPYLELLIDGVPLTIESKEENLAVLRKV